MRLINVKIFSDLLEVKICTKKILKCYVFICLYVFLNHFAFFFLLFTFCSSDTRTNMH